MKARKYIVAAGIPPAEIAELASLLRALAPRLEHAWELSREDDGMDLVLANLADFGGRCARIRALDEGRHLAIVADADEDALDVPLVMRRPLTAKALLDVLAHAGSKIPPAPRRLTDIGITEAPVVARNRANTARQDAGDGQSNRACFLDIRSERVVTDLDALLRRGAVLLEREGLQPLLVDPVTDTFHSPARMRDLEAYFLQPVVGSERRRLSAKKLAELRDLYPAYPLLRLRWLGALLRSNGWLAPRLDPSANYQLAHWLELGSEYRKQRRIALALMRGGPLHRIAASAHAKMADVFDVVNAFSAIGLMTSTPERQQDPQEGKRKNGGKRRLALMRKASRALSAAFVH